VKAVLLDPDGRTVASAGHGCVMRHPASGWAEQDPADWTRGLTLAVRQLIAASGIRPSQVAHLGLASQVDGVVAVDARLRPLRPAIIWLDRRAAGQAADLAAKLGADHIFATTGLNADASHIAPKLMWLRDNEPGIFRQARSFPPVGGYLLGWLTALAQDHANASSTLLYDADRWLTRPLLRRPAWIPACWLAIRPSAQAAGTLTGGGRVAEPPLAAGCVVVTGTGDEHAACVGAGAITPGLVADVTGTAEPVAATAPNAVFDAERVVETHAHAITGLLLVENPGFVSGGCTLWCAPAILGRPGRAVRAGGPGAGRRGRGAVPADHVRGDRAEVE
jgi:xylulokinase